jgi:raffinose/stachyose/melibiose transport system permease protein
MKVKRKVDWRENVSAGIMLSPAVLMLIICSIYPFVWIFRYVNYNYNGFTAIYTGSQNFNRMINDQQFWKSVITTFEYGHIETRIYYSAISFTGVIG